METIIRIQVKMDFDWLEKTMGAHQSNASEVAKAVRVMKFIKKMVNMASPMRYSKADLPLLIIILPWRSIILLRTKHTPRVSKQQKLFLFTKRATEQIHQTTD